MTSSTTGVGVGAMIGAVGEAPPLLVALVAPVGTAGLTGSVTGARATGR